VVDLKFKKSGYCRKVADWVFTIVPGPAISLFSSSAVVLEKR